MNRGICLLDLGRLVDALRACDAGIELHQRDHLAHRPELDGDRAKLQKTRGICLEALGREKNALAAFDAAIAMYQRDHLAERLEFDAHRAGLQTNRGIALKTLHRLDDALIAFDAALALHQRDHLARRPELDGKRAMLYSNRGTCLMGLGRLDDALKAYDVAIGLLEARRPVAAPPEMAALVRALASASQQLRHRSASHAWARDQSTLLVELLDLTPADNITPWFEMREGFAWFHVHWLGFALFGDESGSGRDPNVIPQILLTL